VIIDLNRGEKKEEMFCLFLSNLKATADKWCVRKIIALMGFEPQISGVGIDLTANCSQI
jgi:hypothetical protein